MKIRKFLFKESKNKNVGIGYCHCSVKILGGYYVWVGVIPLSGTSFFIGIAISVF